MDELKQLLVPFEVKQIDNEDPDFFIFEGYASVFNNVDRGDDIVMPGAFKESLLTRTPKVLWQHNSDEPIGMPVELKEDERGLFVKCRLPKADSFVSGRVMPQVKVGTIDSMSIGYRTIDSDLEKRGDDFVRKINKAELWEFSLVTFPMNEAAKVTAFKKATPFKDLSFPMSDGEIDFTKAWDSSAAQARVREFTGSDDGPSASYKGAFLWYDAENDDSFGAYKLPIADVVGGKLVAIPRAIFAAAAALRGARGGVDIPDADRSKVIANINRYYTKMDKPSPFAKNYCPVLDDFKSLKDMTILFKDFGFSDSECTKIVDTVWRLKRDHRKVSESKNVVSDSDSLKSLVSSIDSLTKKMKGE